MGKRVICDLHQSELSDRGFSTGKPPVDWLGGWRAGFGDESVEYGVLSRVQSYLRQYTQ